MMPTMPPDAHKISLKIIEAIRQHPVLYISDVKGTAIKLQEFRQKVWKRISDELGLDASWVRLRWKNLRDTYCRILKFKNKAEKGARRKKWIFEDHLSFLKFPYEPDYVPQCVELSDEYIEEINRGGVGTESLLEQLEDRNDEDYSEYLEVLEETNADPIAILPHSIEIIDNSQQHLTTDMMNSYDSQNVSDGVNIYTQIQSKYRKIRPKRMKLNDYEETRESIELNDNNYGILSPNFKIEQLKLPKVHNNNNNNNNSNSNSNDNHNVNVNPIIITNPTPHTTKVQEKKEEYVAEAKSEPVQAQPVETTSTELFFNSMAQTVKLLPPKAQAEVKMAVCKIVTEAELRCSKKKLSANTQQFITPPGMIPKLVLIPCSMIDNQENK
ncbi:GSCOCG00005724001-RA-CDS [Cotesia congregata]|nr:GSCOCG00005724001-RA-CDS [Cotesia congregata]